MSFDVPLAKKAAIEALHEPNRNLTGTKAVKKRKHWKYGTRFAHQEAIIAMNQYFGTRYNSSSFQSIPRPVQTDVRKHFGIYYVHVRNSHDPLKWINFMNSFVSPDVSLSGIRETVHGFEQVKNEILNIFKVEPPDFAATLLSNEYHRRRNGTSYVKIDAIARGHVIVPKETEESRKQAQTVAVNGPLPAPQSSIKFSTSSCSSVSTTTTTTTTVSTADSDSTHVSAAIAIAIAAEKKNEDVDAAELFVGKVFNTHYREEKDSMNDGEAKKGADSAISLDMNPQFRDDIEQDDTTTDESTSNGARSDSMENLVLGINTEMTSTLDRNKRCSFKDVRDEQKKPFKIRSVAEIGENAEQCLRDEIETSMEAASSCVSAAPPIQSPHAVDPHSGGQIIIEDEDTLAKRLKALWVGVARREKRFEEISGLPPVDQSKKKKTDSGDGGGVTQENNGDGVGVNKGGAIAAGDTTSVAPDHCFQLSPFTACGDVEDEEGDEISERDTYYDDSSIHTIRSSHSGDGTVPTSPPGFTTQEICMRGELILEIGKDWRIRSIRFAKFLPTA